METMKPILIIPVDTMTAEDIKKLNDNGICTVEAKNPALVKFLDPIPSAAQRGQVEQAAIALSRRLLTMNRTDSIYGADIFKFYVDALVRGTALDPNPSQEEEEQRFFNTAKLKELQRLASEEARAERAAKKAQKEAERKKGGEAKK